MVPIVVNTDGGCSPNPGPGGWGVVISMPEGPLDLCGGESDSTNNRMELTAAIRALEYFPEGAQIEMRCDSEYVVNSTTKWMAGWKAKGWRNSKGPVMNLDLMQRLDELTRRRDVKWRWVRGHAGDPLNERADRLVARGRREPCSQSAQPSSTLSDAEIAPTSTLLPLAGAVAARHIITFPIDLALARAISRAAKQAGTTHAVFMEDAVVSSLRSARKRRHACARGHCPRPCHRIDSDIAHTPRARGTRQEAAARRAGRPLETVGWVIGTSGKQAACRSDSRGSPAAARTTLATMSAAVACTASAGVGVVASAAESRRLRCFRR